MRHVGLESDMLALVRLLDSLNTLDPWLFSGVVFVPLVWAQMLIIKEGFIDHLFKATPFPLAA